MLGFEVYIGPTSSARNSAQWFTCVVAFNSSLFSAVVHECLVPQHLVQTLLYQGDVQACVTSFVALIVIASEVLLYTEPQLLLPSVFPLLPVIHL